MNERPPRPAAHELERYAGLFASRTRVMRSSAMRDLMAITERPEVISLAGGLPDTSTFDRALFASLMASLPTARALQYGPSEGLAGVREAIVSVMAAEQMDGRPGRRHRHDRRPAGDRPRLQDADRPRRRRDRRGADLPGRGADLLLLRGRGRSRSRWTRTACGSTCSRRRSRAWTREGRRPKFVYTIPTFQNPAGVTMSLAAPPPARRDRARARADRARGQPLRDAPLRGRRAADAALARGARRLARRDADFVVYTGTMSKILSPGVRVGWLVAPRPVLAKLILGKQSADLCSSSLAQHFVAAYFARRRLAPLRRLAARPLPPPARRDARRARRAPARAGALDPPPGRPLHLGHAARLHRHDQPAGARARRERRVRARRRRRSSTGAAAARCG